MSRSKNRGRISLPEPSTLDKIIGWVSPKRVCAA